MLNEWSDRRPLEPRKPLLLRASFWIGVVVILNCAAVAIPLATWLLG
ncbi:MAG TPA: hypothetical protein VF680_03020 [Allosphingosinicella sp.]|jgi:hypothetical protein